MINAINEFNLNVQFIGSSYIDRLEKSAQEFDVVLLTPPFDRGDKLIPFKLNVEHKAYVKTVQAWIDESVKHLNNDGTILIYSLPRWLPFFAEHLYSLMTFKYWIAIKNQNSISNEPMVQPYHEGVLLFVKNSKKFNINKVRYPHIFCSQCGDFLADWGGKKHLRPEFGPVISDVWDDRADFIDEEHGLSEVTIDRLLRLTCKENSKVLIAMYDCKPYEGIKLLEQNFPNNDTHTSQEIKYRYIDRTISIPSRQKKLEFNKDSIYIGNSSEILGSWLSNPDARFDLIFADPPYNLEKDYGNSDDDLKDQEYISWCDTWLDLCAQLLKPDGTLYVLNLPKWTFFHATLLCKRLWLQRWIAWDALSDPRGKVMPAHYGLLVYTKHPNEFTYNPINPIPKMDQCFRSKCIRNRPPVVPTEELSDIWYDIHRIKHRRDRDAHPCQLPLKLLERVVQISSNPGDIILDPFLGTGTTAIAAKGLGRHYVGIDIDSKYREIALTKLARLEGNDASLSIDSAKPSLPTQLPLFD